jgi:N,N-dimethylformamidase beta subunit-like, C-terminal
MCDGHDMKKFLRQFINSLSLRALFIFILLLVTLSLLLIVITSEKMTSERNPIQSENQLPGTLDWQISNPAPYDTRTFHYLAIEGYAWSTSVEAGDDINFSVNTTSPYFAADIYRLGWYQGKGGRFIQSIHNIQGHSYPLPSPDPQTGLIEANWPVTFTLKTDSHWVSGMYMAKLTASSGKQAYIPFVIRSSRPADFAFIHTANTDEAYNQWGGTSLYVDLTNKLHARRAFKVSFDRPFQQNTGAGQFFWWEYPMVRWLEKNGYDVSYLSDTDIQNPPYPLRSYRALLIVGHSEYWSKQMRDNLEAAVNNGVNLGIFAANSIYWQVRYEPRSSGTSPIPERVLVCYKDKRSDPFYGKNNSLVTVQFREGPLNRPEQSLLGAMYGGWWDHKQPGFPWVVADASSWVFAGTGLKNGDSLPGLVGYEYDKVYFGFPTPPGLDILSVSPVVDAYKNHDVANATLYTARSGARVFDAATFYWSLGLASSSSSVSKATQKITENILQNFLTAGGKSQSMRPLRPVSEPDLISVW